ncbi:four-carbon acid sugar kinase family protein [uncultured Enorma sp.]|uniref:four-carbon acid sugar kinase family protein n=1 Tax=uncultured Enorma sp. TaxID=1714346 RepID=UPI0028057349|nr:four-carbon acid sugar kinase family protein [uncultured Enorma sp.]
MSMPLQPLPIEVLDSYPVIDESAVDALLAQEIAKDPSKIVVLDDDPTGVQTVHDVSVYTDWSLESIRSGFAEKNKLFYILTNSRGMTRDETAAAHREIGSRVAQIARETATPYLVMSRSDSTLRGHYPLETELLREAMEADGLTVDGEVMCPFFKEGGRFTIGDVHYVQQGDELVPAAKTEFARDKTFGYAHSSIPEYIEEKTGGRFRAKDVVCISLDDLRSCDVDRIERQLLDVTGFNKVCVNAIDYCDIKVFAVALYRAMAQGKTFLFRTAAGLVKVLGGVSDIPLLSREDMVTTETQSGGVVVVGSHTQKTTTQLEELLQLDCTVPVAFNSDLVLQGDDALYAEVDRCVALEEDIIRAGKVAVCFTRRNLLEVPNDTKESALLRSVKISDGVQRLVGQLGIAPAFVIAKGGITSSDVGTKALGVKRANVLGQIQPGIPVWQTGAESRFPGMPYVIFPGNTGDETTLRRAVEILTAK